METPATFTENLGTRANVKMYDFGKVEQNATITPLTIEANGTTKAGPYDITLPAATQGEARFRIVVNKDAKFKLRLKTADNTVNVLSQEFTVTKRIRKYANLPSNPNHDLNQHDQAFVDAADHWNGAYQHQMDDIERIKAMGMAESELGITDAVDILTVGNNDDFVIPRLKGLTSGIKLNGQPETWTREFEFVPDGTGQYSRRFYNYQDAARTPARTAIKWGVCWFYKKAMISREDASFGGWRSWDPATTRYNGGGVSNYLERVNRSMKEGRHPSSTTLYIWPILSNKKARGNP